MTAVSSVGCLTTTIKEPVGALGHLQHQLHRHQHRVVVAHQPALGEAARIVNERNVELGVQRAAGTGSDDAGPDRHLRRKRFYNPTIPKTTPDNAPPPAMDFSTD